MARLPRLPRLLPEQARHIMATYELAARLDPREVTVNCLHPGSLLDAKMVREGFGAPQGPVSIGIEAELYVATSPDLEGVTGQYFDRTRPGRAKPQAMTARREGSGILPSSSPPARHSIASPAPAQPKSSRRRSWPDRDDYCRLLARLAWREPGHALLRTKNIDSAYCYLCRYAGLSARPYRFLRGPAVFPTSSRTQSNDR